MGKTSRWLRSFLTGKKEKEKGGNQPPTLPDETQEVTVPAVSTPKEKRRWSFRRAAGAGKDVNSPDPLAATPNHGISEQEVDQKRQVMDTAATDVVVAAARAPEAMFLPTTAPRHNLSATKEAAAIKIQSVFRSYLARKALCALKGLVKLQALVRGQLVRKQATAALRCMQALVTAQTRARVQRIKTVEEAQIISQRQSIRRQSPQRFRQSYENDRFGDENVKIIEMDFGESKGKSKSRNSYSVTRNERMDRRLSSYYDGSNAPSIVDPYQQLSPTLSALTDMSPRACSVYFKEFSINMSQNSPQYLSATSKPHSAKTHFTDSQQEYTYSISHDYPFFPNYMANTQSSRAKARSQSAPKQRPDLYETQPSRRRTSIEGRNIPRGVRMQRSSSQTTVNDQYPWSLKLDRSSVSLKDSECGSSNTILTNVNYCRSLAA